MRMSILALAACLLVFLSGCAKEPPPPPEPITVKVLFNGSSSQFHSLYGSRLAEQYPHYMVEVVDLQQTGYRHTTDSLKKAIQETAPDIIQLEQAEYRQLASEGLIVNLDARIQESAYDLSKLYPPIVELLRKEGGGSIFGLSPYFFGTALFYNKTLFEKYGVPLPRDGMTWAEVLELASRFPADGELTGIYHGPVRRSSFIFSALGEAVRYYDSTGRKLLVDTEQWRAIWSRSVAAYRSGALRAEASQAFVKTMTDEQELSRIADANWFAAGKSAMKVARLDMADTIEQLGGKDGPSFEWDVVTKPVGIHEPDVAQNMELWNILSISSSSSQKEAAWDIVRFINGEAMAKQLASVSGGGYLPTMMGMLPERPGVNLEAFYKLRKASQFDTTRRIVPVTFVRAFYDLADQEIDAVLAGDKTEEQALRDLQVSGQKLLDAEWLKQGQKSP